MFKHTKKGKTWIKVVGIIFLVVVILGSGATLYARRWYTNSLSAVSGNTEAVSVTIEQGSSPKDIALLLESKGLIRSAKAFETYVRGTGDSAKLKAGVFELSQSMTTQEIVSVLVEGKEASSLFTIGPGLRLDQIKKRLVDAGYAEVDVDNALKPEQYTSIPIVRTIKPGATLEGYLYPETFRITKSSTPKDIIQQSLNELDKVITTKLASEFEARGLTIYEAITLASIIEKEVPAFADRQQVAQVFYSRLEMGIPLGADATYLYASAVEGSEPFPTNKSPYNTRIVGGLPPGPISNASRTALEAVAEPATTEYLFYVTGDDGVNHFTKTEAEHNAAVAKYCTITCAPGYVAKP